MLFVKLVILVVLVFFTIRDVKFLVGGTKELISSCQKKIELAKKFEEKPYHKTTWLIITAGFVVIDLLLILMVVCH